MPARRVPGPAGAAPDRLVSFTFDGHEYQGVEGEPLAASLLAAGRPVLSRSFRFHRPRGLMCSTGQCGWCECEVDGVPSVRSCRVPLRDGLVGRGEHAWPSVGRDLLALLGIGSRWIPPTFYHHRFLRPRRLRKRYLDVLRWFGGRGRLALDGSPRAVTRATALEHGRHARAIESDVLVVGGGRAGLHAAIGAAAAEARVVLLEAEPAIGGGWRTERGADDPAGRVEDLAVEAAAAGVLVLTGVAAVGWYDGRLTAIGATEHFEIAARAVVAATGSYDRVPFVPGADRPGVVAARTVAFLVERYGILPGTRPLLVGTGRELASAGELLATAGAGAVRGPIATAALVSVLGQDRVTGADVQVGGRRSRLAADLLVFGDRSPNLDLPLAAGAAVERDGDTLVPVTDAEGRTSVRSLFVVGSASGRALAGADEAAAARAAGRAAATEARRGESIEGGRTTEAGAAAEVGGAAEPTGDVTPTNGGPRRPANHNPNRVARGAMVCFCEDVRAWEIRAEQAAGYADPELVKRRTGALTGPCQGKHCLQSFACLVPPEAIPTARPPLRPTRLIDLVAADPTETPSS